MVAGERHAGQDRLGLAVRRDLASRQRIAHDPVVHLGIDRIVVDGDPGAASGAVGYALAEALDDVGMPGCAAVLQRQQESTGWRRVVVIVAPAPGVGVDGPVGCNS
jgi:hypothetical protein